MTSPDTDALARIADSAALLAATLTNAVDAANTIGAELAAIRRILDRPADTISVRPTATVTALQYATASSPPPEQAAQSPLHSLLPNSGGGR